MVSTELMELIWLCAFTERLTRKQNGKSLLKYFLTWIRQTIHLESKLKFSLMSISIKRKLTGL